MSPGRVVTPDPAGATRRDKTLAGEIGSDAGAEGATAPETLRRKDRKGRQRSGKRLVVIA